MSRRHPLRVGVFGIGLEAYWEQFPGLRQRLEGCLAKVTSRLQRPGVELCDLGLIDSPEKAMEAGHALRRADVDIIFLHVTTYALSSTVLPVVQRARVPVIVLNLQPVRAIDYASFNRMDDRRAMTGDWLAHCSACPLPEIANAFRRARIDFHQVTGTLEEDDPAWADIDEWIQAARVANVMAHNRLGLLGHYYNGMLDIHTDTTRQVACFGGHLEIVEVEELAAIRRRVGTPETKAKLEEFSREFELLPDCPPGELERAARTAVALDQLVSEKDLGSLAYYHKGTGQPEHEDVMSSVILGMSLLTARGIPTAGEYEIKNAQAMKIMDSFGAGGSFTEFYAMDFNDDLVLMGHDGPGHIGVASGRITVRPLTVYHGKVGSGLSVEMSVRHGPVTLLSVVETAEGWLKFVVAEGESVSGSILEIGNTNSRYRFSIGAKAFIERWCEQGPAHHCAVGVGSLSSRIAKLGALLGVETIRIC